MPYQKKNIKSEVMPSYINEFVMVTLKRLRKMREDKQFQHINLLHVTVRKIESENVFLQKKLPTSF